MSGKFTEDVLDSTEIYDGTQGSNHLKMLLFCVMSQLAIWLHQELSEC